MKSLSRQIAQEDPEAALAWATSISDADARGKQTEQLAREWLSVDPANARKWIDTSPLPAEVRQRLLR